MRFYALALAACLSTAAYGGENIYAGLASQPNAALTLAPAYYGCPKGAVSENAMREAAVRYTLHVATRSSDMRGTIEMLMDYGEQNANLMDANGCFLARQMSNAIDAAD